jgi:hypothetical protein
MRSLLFLVFLGLGEHLFDLVIVEEPRCRLASTFL